LLRLRCQVGVFMEGGSARGVAVTPKAGGFRVEAFASVDLGPGAVVDGEVRDPAGATGTLRELRTRLGVRPRRVFTAVDGSSTVARLMELPPMPDRELREALRWEVPQHLPLPADEAVTDVAVVERPARPGPMTVLLVATRRSSVTALIAVLAAAGLPPRAVEVPSLAQWRALALTAAPPPGPVLLLNARPGQTDLHVVRRGTPLVTRTLAPCAGPDGPNGFLRDLGASLRFLLSQHRGLQLAGAYLYGRGLPRQREEQEGLAEAISAYAAELGGTGGGARLPVETPDLRPLATGAPGDGGGFDSGYLTALGLALRGVPA
jgi:type IV pilus assembly protein PilM